MLNLHPDGWISSGLTGINGDTVVGNVFKDVIAPNPEFEQAGLWTGSATSFVNLQPSDALACSAVNAMSGKMEVGEVYAPNEYYGQGPPQMSPYTGHAALWSGSAECFVNLNPPAASDSIAFGICPQGIAGGVFVGQWSFAPWSNWTEHAAIWLGTPSNCIDLQAESGANWSFSQANAIYADSTGVFVVGVCDAGAVLWHIPAPDVPAFQLPSTTARQITPCIR